MSYELDSAAGYRQHAEELRGIADSAMDSKHQKQLRSIAADYEHMADQMEQIAKTYKKLKRPRG